MWSEVTAARRQEDSAIFCRRCRRMLPEGQFYAGNRSTCRSCKAQRAAERRKADPAATAAACRVERADDVRAAYYCVAEVVRHRQRTGEPIPDWLRRHFDRLDAEIRLSEIRVSESGQDSDSDTGQFDQNELITAREVSQMLGCSKRQAQRLASDLDGCQFVGGRWLFRRSSVAEYAEGRRRRAV